MPNELIKEQTLNGIELLFNANSTSVTKFNLLAPTLQTNQFAVDRLLLEELYYNTEELKVEHSTLLAQLNNEQRNAYEDVLNSVINNEGRIFFVHGHGGTGKTFLWKTIISAVRSYGNIVLAVASSRIASLLLPGGRTTHSHLKIPLEVDDFSTCEVKKGTQLARLHQRTVLIVWDEAPMIHRNCLEALDKTLQDIMSLDQSQEKNVIFGGKTVLLRGEFHQNFQVIPGGSKEDILNACIYKSPLWKFYKVLLLKTNMKLMSNFVSLVEKKRINELAEWILDIGNGSIKALSFDASDNSVVIEISDDLLITPGSDSIKTICDAVYIDFLRNYREMTYLQQRAIVTPYNETVDLISEYMVSLILGQ